MTAGEREGNFSVKCAYAYASFVICFKVIFSTVYMNDTAKSRTYTDTVFATAVYI